MHFNFAFVKKQQLVFISGAVILFIALYFFGNTIPPKTAGSENPAVSMNGGTKKLTTNDLLSKAKASLTQQQISRITQLENSVVRGDVKTQQIGVYKQLANFWGDTMNHQELAAYYIGETAKLENSEKNLNFAARFLLDSLMATDEPTIQNWMATQAKALFEKSLEINPTNDSSKIGIGACYLFGGIADNPMQGILAIKEIADKNPENMYAQWMLSLGDIKSGQYDKAIEHLLIIVNKEPGNIEAIINLAESYERKGDKQNAVKWYRTAAGLVNIPEAQNEIEKRIKALQ